MVQTPLDQGLNLSDWLISTQEKRDELDAYGKSPLPLDAGERHVEIERAIQNADDSGRLLADAESFLSQAKAQAVLAMIDKYPDLSSKEREIMVKDAVRGVQRLVDGISVTNRTINHRIFVIQNANRARL